jgi:hypothetical protein
VRRFIATALAASRRLFIGVPRVAGHARDLARWRAIDGRDDAWQRRASVRWSFDHAPR